jgi:hypothetical protein
MRRRHKFYGNLCMQLKNVFWFYRTGNYAVDPCCKYVCPNVKSALQFQLLICNFFNSVIFPFHEFLSGLILETNERQLSCSLHSKRNMNYEFPHLAAV